MIQTSNTYNPDTTVRSVDMKLEFDLIEREATNGATYSINEENTVSNLNQLSSGETNNVKYATCEENLVKLDGTWDYLPDTITTNENTGWWSNAVSDENGEFTTNPKLTVVLDDDYSCIGFTLYTENTNIIEEFKIKVLNGDIEIYEEIFIGNGTNVLIADMPITDFNKIEVEITKTKENCRRVKMLGFRVGIIKTWNKDKIVSANITEEVDVSAQTLPINELNVELDNSDGTFDMFSSTHEHKRIYMHAMKTARIYGSKKGSIAKLNELGNGITKLNYATCEENLVKLDGTWDYLDDNKKNLEVGYVNDALSDGNGYFPTTEPLFIGSYPTIVYHWDSHINISGIRIYFGRHIGETYQQNVVREGKIYIDDGNHRLKTIEFSNNNREEVVDIDVEVSGLDGITFVFTRVYGDRKFVKIPEIHFLSYVDDNWGTYLTKNQRINASFIINGEEVSMGTYRFDTLEQTNDGMTAKLTAKNYVAQLGEQKYGNGAHGTTTLDLALKNVLSDTGIDIVYKSAGIVDTLSGNWEVSTAAPKNTTKRAALRYFCQAACATCYIDRQEKLRVLTLTATSHTIGGYTGNYKFNADNMYNRDIIKLSEYVNMIRLTVKDEYTDPETENIYYGGSGLYYREIENNCVAESMGEDVANWILGQKSRRVYFEIQSRGNPALELGDTVQIKTKDGMIYYAVIYYQNFSYDGGLKCTMRAIV